MIGRGEQMKVRTYIEQHRRITSSRATSSTCARSARSSPSRSASRARAWEMTSRAARSRRTTASGTQPLRPRAARPADARGAARERGDQRDLDRRPRPLQLRRRLQRRPAAATRCVRARASEWVETDWETALAQAAEGLRGRGAGPRRAGERLEHARGALSARPHRARPRQRATSITACGSATSATRPPIRVFPSLGHAHRRRSTTLRGAAASSAANLRREVPILAHRVRKAARAGRQGRAAESGALRLSSFRSRRTCRRRRRDQVADLAAILRGRRGGCGRQRCRRTSRPRCDGAQVERRSIAHAAAALATGEQRAVWLGALALRHPRVRGPARARRRAGRRSPAPARRARRGRQCGRCLSRRRRAASRGGRQAGAQPGLTARRDAGSGRCKAYLLFGGVEPWVDAPDAETPRDAREGASSSSPSRRLRASSCAKSRTCCCRSGTFAETSGTYVNLEGRVAEPAGRGAAASASRAPAGRSCACSAIC